MHELRLVGVHEDGEHLMLTGADGARFVLRVDDAVRAAVRRDRSRLGQLQIEIEGGLRPRDVQARIRAGISAEDVAAMAGWTVEKVRRYEGPVLAERAHVADLARAVRVRRRSADPVALGALVAQRLGDRGVDQARVAWDAWRPDTGPWVVVVAFEAGDREREARWHFDPGAASVTAADDEARWLSEDEPAASGPLAAATTGRPGAVYDIEADGGVGAEPRRDLDGGPFDLVGAMRSRRRERDTRNPAARRRPPTHGGTRVASTGDRPSDVPGAAQGLQGSAHPAGRKRGQPEPLELDPTLMDDPPAAHPPASLVPSLLAAEAAVVERPDVTDLTDLNDLGDEPALGVDVELDFDVEPAVEPLPGGPTPAEPSPDVPTPVQPGPTQPEPVVPEPFQPEPFQPSRPDAPGPLSEQPARPAAAAKRGKRPSVPSWDDIMFGTKRD